MRYFFYLLLVALLGSSFVTRAQQLVPRCGTVVYKNQPNHVDIVYPGVKLSDIVATSDSAHISRLDDTTLSLTPAVKGKTLIVFLKIKSKGKTIPVEVPVKITKKPVVRLTGLPLSCSDTSFCTIREKDIKPGAFNPGIVISIPTGCKRGAYTDYGGPPDSYKVSINGKTFSSEQRYSKEYENALKQFRKGKIIYTEIKTKWDNTLFIIPKAEITVQ